MLAYRNLREIVNKVVQWETDLKGFYEVAEVALKNPESRRLVSMLREKLEERLAVLRAVEVDRHGSVEFVQFAPKAGQEDLIRKGAITRSSTPEEVLRVILRSDQDLERFYRDLAARLVSRSQKDLFESLAVFKAEQIASINRYMAQAAP